MQTSDLAILMAGWKEALVQQSCERLFERYPELGRRYSGNRRPLFDDMAYHVDFITVAFRYESPILFYQYLVWNRNLFYYLNILPDHVRYTFEVLLDSCAMMSPEPYHALLVPYRGMVQEVFSRTPAEEPSQLGPNNPLSSLAVTYYQALRRGNRAEAFEYIDAALAAGVSPQDIYLHVFQSALREIGYQWYARKASVAEEHYFTIATQQAMARLLPLFASGAGTPRRMALAACVQNEAHDIGLRMVADFLEQDGWNVRCCGAGTPNRAILDMLDFDQPRVLALSATMLPHLETMESLIRDVRKHKAAGELKIIVGGYPFLQDSNLWRRLGADAMALDARQTVQFAREW